LLTFIHIYHHLSLEILNDSELIEEEFRISYVRQESQHEARYE